MFDTYKCSPSINLSIGVNSSNIFDIYRTNKETFVYIYRLRLSVSIYNLISTRFLQYSSGILCNVENRKSAHKTYDYLSVMMFGRYIYVFIYENSVL